MKKLAICVPTYNRPLMIEEMLIRCLKNYESHNIDLFIYDSGEGYETKEKTFQFIEQHHNLRYIRISPSIHSNLKVLNIYREHAGSTDYEYIWICPDYVQLTTSGINSILEACKDRFDLCVLNYRDVEHIGTREYSDINDFFVDCAWHMTSYMATIVRTDSFVNFDWDTFIEKYTVTERINHSHVALYFEQIARLAMFRGIHISLRPEDMSVSSFREESYWKEELFTVWCEYWPCTVRALPDVYDKKNIVIKKLGVNTKLLSFNNFLNFRKEKIYNMSVFCKYQSDWGNLSRVPKIVLYWIAKIPSENIAKYTIKPAKEQVLEIYLGRFCKRYESIYIYGCGMQAKKISGIMDRLQIVYNGYIVTNTKQEKEEFNNHTVRAMSEDILYDKKAGIILALNEKNSKEVMEGIINAVDKNRLFLMYKFKL